MNRRRGKMRVFRFQNGIVKVSAFLALIVTCAGCTTGGNTDAAGVKNFGEVTPEVWRGGKPTPQGMQWLADRGVKTIIDLQMEDESRAVPQGVRYLPLRVSMWECDCVDTSAVVKAIDESSKPVFIHCQAGRDRTGLAVAAWRVAHGMSANDAIAEMERYGKNAWWSRAIKSKIRKLEREKAGGGVVAESQGKPENP